MKTQTKNVEGGTPSQGGPKGKSKQRDDSQKPSGLLKEEAIRNSEKVNMTQKKGYNEPPATIPVKSRKG